MGHGYYAQDANAFIAEKLTPVLVMEIEREFVLQEMQIRALVAYMASPRMGGQYSE